MIVVGKLSPATVKDFGGGWNVADSPLNLTSRYQTVSDNVLRGSDGSFFTRWGTALAFDFRAGTETTYTDITGTYQYNADNEQMIVFNWVGHPFSTGDHVTISGLTVDIGTENPIAYINHRHAVRKIDDDSFGIPALAATTDTSTPDLTGAVFVRDTHVLGGDIIHITYFNRHLVAYDTYGEIAIVNADGVMSRIWDGQLAQDLEPTIALLGSSEFVSTTTFKTTLVSVNGYDGDKPIQIMQDMTATFLYDKATFSNASVPKADYIIGLFNYLILGRTQYGDTLVEFSAKGTDGTFTRELDPGDAVEIDLSMVTETVEPRIFGMSVLRDKLYVAFYDRSMLGSIGQYVNTAHEPSFDDTIAEHGAVSNRTLIPLGNDVIMADHSGVPSVGMSLASGVFMPQRVSELIGPEIQKHLARLSENTLRNRAFAVFNKNDSMYMLFLPKYDEVTKLAAEDPFFFNTKLRERGYVYFYAPNHQLIEDSWIRVSGATDLGSIEANVHINKPLRVVSVVDSDAVILDIGVEPTQKLFTNGGGDNVTFTPINDETICYGYEYNRGLKIRRWTRLRGWNFAAGCVSQRGTTYFAKGGKVYRYGSSSEPLHADYIGEYDYPSYTQGMEYQAGDRVRAGSGRVYTCKVTYVTSQSTFALERAAMPDHWEEYLGIPIKWALHTPWSDLQSRASEKKIVNAYHDTQGTGLFEFAIFANQILRDPDTNELIPYRKIQHSAGDTGGFGVSTAKTWGSGRRTRENYRWPIPVRGKLFMLRWAGETREFVRVVSTTMLYYS